MWTKKLSYFKKRLLCWFEWPTLLNSVLFQEFSESKRRDLNKASLSRYAGSIWKICRNLNLGQDVASSATQFLCIPGFPDIKGNQANNCISTGSEIRDLETQFIIHNELINRKVCLPNGKASSYIHQSNVNKTS